MKKKFSLIVYLLIMAMFILPMSGCDIGDDDKKSGGSSATASKLVVVTSRVFEESGDYKIIKGNGLVSGAAVENPMCYVAPYNTSNPERTLNLEFAGEISSNDGFIITDGDGLEVLFAYNPEGNGEDINKTGNVNRKGTQGKVQKYTTLDLSPAVASSTIEVSDIGVDTGEAVSIVLKSDGTATVGSTSIEANDFVWHISPDHKTEYWTSGKEGSELDGEPTIPSEKIANGVYIARDIRYVPNYLPFSEAKTAIKAKGSDEGNNDKFYVAYYDETAVGSADTYILAALPANTGVPAGGPGEASVSPSASDFDTVFEKMTHDPDEAYKNYVLHITKPGMYRLKGTWKGQIWVDIPDNSVNSAKTSEKDDEAYVYLILDGVDVTCTVAPALVFKNVYECNTHTTSNVATTSMDVYKDLMTDETTEKSGDVIAGAVVMIAKGTTNKFSGTNVARINKAKLDDDDYENEELGKYVKAQKKYYKLDGAVHSRMSMIIGIENGDETGNLDITSSYEGLDSEMHMLIDSGTISVTAEDDGINVNKDNLSVFTMRGGNLTIKSSGGDGIDSNGYVVVTDGKLDITAGSERISNTGEAGIDAEKGVYIYDDTAYTWTKVGGKDPTKPDDRKVPSDNKITFSDGSSITYYATKSVALAEGDKTNEERIAAGVPETSETFKLVNKVNNFGGLTDK